MCGICGLVGRGPVDREALARMTSVLHHRGPDDEGFFVHEYDDVAVGLGFRRLSIIDLDTGNQPIGNEDGSLQVVFNGEIYNFRELRRELQGHGHRFSKKPLHYAEVGSSLLFGSELKALLEHPACPRNLDLESLSRYLALEYVPAPHSIFDGIRKLPGGHLLRWRDGKSTIEPYWDLTFADADVRTDDEWVEEFRVRLRGAVD